MGDFKQLRAWRSAMDLVEAIYRESESFPTSERYGLQIQLRRAAVSVAANIAEGSAKDSDRDFARFLKIARGSAAELECLSLVCARLGRLPQERTQTLLAAIESVAKQILALQRGLDS
jgi:four helix bundle protein